MALTKKQKEVFDFIRSYFEKEGYAPTQKEIKEEFEFKSFGSVQRYIKYLADAGLLECDWNARRGLKLVDSDEHGPIPLSPKNVHPTHFDSHNENNDDLYNVVSLPLLGKVAAGTPIEAIEHSNELIRIPKEFIRSSGQHFALKVCGDSMIEDGILNNDIIICRAQEQAEQGQTVVALIDGETTVKRFYKKKTHYELHPANSTMVPIILSEREFSLAGIVVGLFRKY